MWIFFTSHIIHVRESYTFTSRCSEGYLAMFSAGSITWLVASCRFYSMDFGISFTMRRQRINWRTWTLFDVAVRQMPAPRQQLLQTRSHRVSKRSAMDAREEFRMDCDFHNCWLNHLAGVISWCDNVPRKLRPEQLHAEHTFRFNSLIDGIYDGLCLFISSSRELLVSLVTDIVTDTDNVLCMW